LWMNLLPCSLRKKDCTMTLCSILFIQIFIMYLNGYLKCRSKEVLSAIRDGEIFSLNKYDWFRIWFSFEDAIRLLTILNPEKYGQRVRYFFAILYTNTLLFWGMLVSNKGNEPFHLFTRPVRQVTRVMRSDSNLWVIWPLPKMFFNESSPHLTRMTCREN
jgi:hypothetical protein